MNFAAHETESPARICRMSGCGERAHLRGFCVSCWGCYLRRQRQAEARLELWALAVRAEVEEGLVGAPELWDAMAVNLAAWRSLAADKYGSRRGEWWPALLDTIAEAVGL